MCCSKDIYDRGQTNTQTDIRRHAHHNNPLLSGAEQSSPTSKVYFLLQSTKDDLTVTRGNPYKLFVNYCLTNSRGIFFSERVVKVRNCHRALCIFHHWQPFEILQTRVILGLFAYACMSSCNDPTLLLRSRAYILRLFLIYFCKYLFVTISVRPIAYPVAWHSGRTSVSDWRTFPVLRSICS